MPTPHSLFLPGRPFRARIFAMGLVLKLGLTATLFLTGCEFFEDDGSSSSAKTEGAIPLFQGSLPESEKTAWTFESGIRRSSVGTLNPLLFSESDSPLRHPGARIRLNFFSDSKAIAVVDQVQTLPGGRLTSQGHVEGVEGSTILVSSQADGLAAVINLAEHGSFRVSASGITGKFRVVEHNDYEPKEDSPETPVIVLQEPTEPLIFLPKAGSPQASRQIDILFVYTAAALSGAGGVSGIENLIALAVAEINADYAASGIDVQVNLAHAAQISYSESRNMTTDLNRVKGTTDGYMDGVHALRNQHGADVVCLVTETDNSGYAGLGFVMKPPGSYFADYAFHVVLRSYLVGYHVVPHELGHNLGCVHDRNNASSSGAYSYSYGHRFYGTNSVQYRTVMAYAPGTRIGRFSNPDISYQGTPTGNSTTNNALSINNTAGVMAAFRGVNQPPTISVTGPGAGNYGAPTTLILRASASDDWGLDSVVYYASGARIGRAITTPFSLPWIGGPSGSYTLTARAFDNGGLSTTSAGVALTLGSSSLPSPWNDAFIGLAGTVGTAAHASGAYTLTAATSDLAGQVDGARFAYRTLSGDGRISLRLGGFGKDSVLAKAGIMVRDTVTPDARALFFGSNPQGELQLYARTAPRGRIARKWRRAGESLPPYLMLLRKGKTFTGYTSSDGENWFLAKGFGQNFPDNVLMGFSLTSANSEITNTATFSAVSFQAGNANHPPQITFGGPLPGSVVNPGVLVPLSARATDLDGRRALQRVAFKRGNELLGIDSLSPYSFLWTATSGTDSLTATVIDTAGDSTTAPGVAFRVAAAGQDAAIATKDATLRDGRYAASNYGSARTLNVRSHSRDGYEFESVISFPLTGVGAITAATLRLYGRSSTVSAVPVRVYAASDTAWIERGNGVGVSYSARPTVGTLQGTVTPTLSSYTWFEVDVTSYVAARKTAGAAYVTFVLRGVSETTAYALFSSREASLGQPTLYLR